MARKAQKKPTAANHTKAEREIAKEFNRAEGVGRRKSGVPCERHPFERLTTLYRRAVELNAALNRLGPRSETRAVIASDLARLYEDLTDAVLAGRVYAEDGWPSACPDIPLPGGQFSLQRIPGLAEQLGIERVRVLISELEAWERANRTET